MKFQLEKGVEILMRTPKVLNHLLSGLSDEWIYTNEGENTWSPYDVVGHLIHGEKTDWISRVRIILSDEADKTFEPFDRFAQFENNQGKSIDDLLEEFEVLREKNIVTLRSLPVNENLTKTGNHPELGKVNLQELLATWVVHDLNHIHQISRVMLKNYKSEVGAWKAYMPILH